MDSLEELFVSKLNDLVRSMSLTNDYEALRISGVLRQLLFDANPLVHAVNRTHRLPIRFRVARQMPRALDAPEPIVDLPLHGIDPEMGPGPTAVDELSIKDFLRYARAVATQIAGRMCRP